MKFLWGIFFGASMQFVLTYGKPYIVNPYYLPHGLIVKMKMGNPESVFLCAKE